MKNEDGLEDGEPEEKRRKIEGPERPVEASVENPGVEIKQKGKETNAEVKNENLGGKALEEEEVPQEPPKVKQVNAIKIVEGFF